MPILLLTRLTAKPALEVGSNAFLGFLDKSLGLVSHDALLGPSLADMGCHSSSPSEQSSSERRPGDTESTVESPGPCAITARLQLSPWWRRKSFLNESQPLSNRLSPTVPQRLIVLAFTLKSESRQRVFLGLAPTVLLEQVLRGPDIFSTLEYSVFLKIATKPQHHNPCWQSMRVVLWCCGAVATPAGLGRSRARPAWKAEPAAASLMPFFLRESPPGRLHLYAGG